MKISRLSIVVFILMGCLKLDGQESDISKKGAMYFYWGYNRSTYSLTNLHFNGPEYDFTLYELKGRDRPTKFGWGYFNPSRLTIPQYNLRAGYYLTDRITISLGTDHMKFILEENQRTRMSGVITAVASEKYEGSYLNEPINLENDLLQFEHSDGFNFASIDLAYLIPLYKKHKFSVLLNVGIGGIWIITKTKVKVFNEGLDNDFHIAGYAGAGKIGPRIVYNNRFFLLWEVKGGYASLPSVLIKNSDPEIGDHNLSFLESYIAVGANFKIKKRKKKE